MKIDFELGDLTNSALRRLVRQLLSVGDGEEKAVMELLKKRARGKNDLADLDEEMHGKPNTPEVEEDDIEDGEELPEIPKKKGKRA